jgi:hypothetical protein
VAVLPGGGAGPVALLGAQDEPVRAHQCSGHNERTLSRASERSGLAVIRTRLHGVG